MLLTSGCLNSSPGGSVVVGSSRHTTPSLSLLPADASSLSLLLGFFFLDFNCYDQYFCFYTDFCTMDLGQKPLAEASESS